MELAKNVQFIPAKPNREITPAAIYCRVSTADVAQLDSLYKLGLGTDQLCQILMIGSLSMHM